MLSKYASKQIRKLGREAYLNGVPLTGNPFPADSEDAALWEAGHKDARNDYSRPTGPQYATLNGTFLRRSYRGERMR